MGQVDDLKKIQQEIDTRLVELDSELENLTGAELDPADTKVFTTLATKRGRLIQERESLLLRHEAVTRALAQAEQEIAESRVTMLATELGDLAEEGEKEATEFARLINRLTELVDVAADRRRQFFERRDELLYLAARYNLDSPPLPTFSTLNSQPLQDFHLRATAALVGPTYNEWATRLEKLRDERNAAVRRQPRPQGNVTQYQESSSSFLARQSSGEPRAVRPNKLRRLLQNEW